MGITQKPTIADLDDDEELARLIAVLEHDVAYLQFAKRNEVMAERLLARLW